MQTLAGVGAGCSDSQDFEITDCGEAPPPDGGDGCPWYDPRCWDWDLCTILGILLAILIALYILAIATGVAADISALLAGIPGFPVVDPATLMTIIGGVLASLMALYLSICGACNLGWVMVAGGALGILSVLALLPFITMPHWLGALITAAVIVLSGYAVTAAACG